MKSLKSTKGWLLLCAAVAAWAVLGSASAQTSVRFDQSRYDIDPGQTFEARIILEASPVEGISSFGVKLSFNAANALGTADSIIIPAFLDFNGVNGASAVKAAGPDFVAVKGTVDFSTPVQTPYRNQLLATFLVADKAAGSHTLHLGFFNTLGPTEEIFVDGHGSVFDSNISFGTALVNYRPLVRIVSPLNGSSFVFPSAIQLLADATDLDGSVACVKFCEGTNIFGQVTNTPFTFAWTNVPVGTHIVKAIAVDHPGATSTSSNLTILVRSNAPPVARFDR